ncbi:MAG: CehA/McbA family metallohydrolase, partial [Candidatus Krumholzibacteria bacterium]|nr:CehA/McbA family metallohydrolase [Candidatus Krumholzibacteria bacterium]
MNIHCSIVDGARRTPLSTRCKIVDSTGKNRYPPSSVSFYHSANGGYFYANGDFSCAVPPGPLTLTLKRGFEYREVALSLNVVSDTSFVVGLERFISMDVLGWFSGDAHTHINHADGYYVLDPEDALLMAGAEGLNIVNCLDNSYYFTGAPASCSAPDCVVFMGEEMRSASYGHFNLLGLKSLILPFSSIWWPLAMDIADSAHAQRGALVIAAHPSPADDFLQVEGWPGSGIARELPVDCILGKVDAIDVMSYSNFRNGGVDLDTWYRLLNSGFRIPASAGTDAAANRLESPPFGGFRAYVRVADDGFRAESWFEGLAAGRTFVTNGPLITRFEIGGRASGDSCSYAHPGAVVPGRVSVESAYPIDRIEIVRNGRVELILRLQPARISVDASFSLSLYESSWIAARVSGTKRGWIVAGDSLYAHTSPVYC